MISHNKDFTNNICKEKWIVDKGYLVKEGEVANDEKININTVTSDVVYDSLGNEIKVKRESNN